MSGITGSLNEVRQLAGALIPRGNDGVSPVVSVSETDGGHNVSITDIHGTKTFYVCSGKKGEKGEKGEKGDTGEQGEKGDPGYTPVKGVDYFTPEEVREFAASVDLTGYAKIDEVPTKVSQLENDHEYASMGSLILSENRIYTVMEAYAQTIPEKVSQLENDMYYAPVEEVDARVYAIVNNEYNFQTEEEVKALINEALGVIENGTY